MPWVAQFLHVLAGKFGRLGHAALSEALHGETAASPAPHGVAKRMPSAALCLQQLWPLGERTPNPACLPNLPHRLPAGSAKAPLNHSATATATSLDVNAIWRSAYG